MPNLLFLKSQPVYLLVQDEFAIYEVNDPFVQNLISTLESSLLTFKVKNSPTTLSIYFNETKHNYKKYIPFAGPAGFRKLRLFSVPSDERNCSVAGESDFKVQVQQGNVMYFLKLVCQNPISLLHIQNRF